LVPANLRVKGRASLLVFDAGAEDDPLNTPRLTLIGQVDLVPEQDLENARALYLARHPNAQEWIEFGDFALYRLTITEAYWVGGFGKMGWLSGGASASRP
jgi:putative heme iron utilization protein